MYSNKKLYLLDISTTPSSSTSLFSTSSSPKIGTNSILWFCFVLYQNKVSDQTVAIITSGLDGIHSNTVPTKNVEILGETTCQLPPLLYGSIGHTTFILPFDDLILTCGGEIGFFQGTSRSCFAYDKIKGNWTLHSSFTTKRIHAISITMEKSVYVLGGVISNKTSEILETGSKIWIEGPEIPDGTANACGVRFNEIEFMLIGGSADAAKRILIYNTENKQWRQFSKELEIGRSKHACIISDNNLMVIGGIDMDGNTLKDTEIVSLDSNSNVIHADLNMPRKNFGVAELSTEKDSRILVFGGQNGYGLLSSVEEWSTLEKKWKILDSNLSGARSNFGFATIPKSLICGERKLELKVL